MHYDFSYIFKEDDNFFKFFEEKYLNNFNVYDNESKLQVVKNYYKEIYTIVHQDFALEELLNLFQKLAKYKILHDVPYLIIVNEINGLKNLLLEKIFVLKKNEEDIENVLFVFKEVHEKVAYIYLMEYVQKLLSSNNIRISSIHDIVEADLLHHYEAHLIWLSKLAKKIKDQDIENFVELDDKLCEFGKWLHSDAKDVIRNNSKYKAIVNLHKNLHLFASKIYSNLNHGEYHIYMSYLEKCEFISLSLGTELALIDNTQMNKKIKKDELTGALNRNSLKGVFEHQYELALATNNSFVMAMCDLDHFKTINDTFGHVIGDKILTHFVEIAKKHIRNADMIIRYGGEEFVIMLSSIHQPKGMEVLEQIRKDFENHPLNYDGEFIKATVSIGLMELKPEQIFQHDFLDKYINIIDKKLYLAKNSGRNRIESY